MLKNLKEKFAVAFLIPVVLMFGFMMGASIGTLFADPYNLDRSREGLEDFWHGLAYKQTSVTMNAASLQKGVTFYGYATFCEVRYATGTAQPVVWRPNWATLGSTYAFNVGDEMRQLFYKPVSSPSIVSVGSLPEGATLQVTIGGLKGD